MQEINELNNVMFKEFPDCVGIWWEESKYERKCKSKKWHTLCSYKL